MRLLLWLYPAEWRRRYGAEMCALLRQSRPGPRDAWDLLHGALDAHLYPQWPARWRRGRRLVAAFAALLGLRFLADWLLLPVVVALTARAGAGASVALGLAVSVVEVALWGLIAVLVLRRSRLPWPAALAAGCVLELLLGSTGISLASMAFVPGYLEPLRVAVWAAIMAVLARGRRGFPEAEPPYGAPVPARPMPEPPEPVVARGRRAS
jgi:hypothetical protein